MGLNFRAEIFNLFNHTQFGLPVNDVSASGFGAVNSTVNNPRLVQLASNYLSELKDSGNCKILSCGLEGGYFYFCACPFMGRHAQIANGDKDPKAIVELGAATSWNFSGGAATFAPNLAAEITPIENWLELEAGVSPFYTRNSTEWDTDLLFKKPWTLSQKGGVHAGRWS